MRIDLFRLETIRKHLLEILFTGLFLTISVYIAFIQTEKYRSGSRVIIKNLMQPQAPSLLGGILLGQNSGMQDNKRLELFIQSSQMFRHLDRDFNLSGYYSSETIDFIQRLSPHALLPFHRLNGDNLLVAYRNDLSLLYDEPSNTLEISFYHADPSIAQRIVEKIVQFSMEALNRFEKENAKVALKELLLQERENKELFIESIKRLIDFQNSHETIDPNIDIQTKSSILASLESELVKSEVEYETLKSQMTAAAPEVRRLKENIRNLKKNIEAIRKEFTEHGDKELNRNLFQYELLKNEVEFNRERYRQTLIKLEETKMAVHQNAKNIVVLSPPGISEVPSKPSKLKDIVGALIILGFLYGIIKVLIAIIKEHKD